MRSEYGRLDGSIVLPGPNLEHWTSRRMAEPLRKSPAVHGHESFESQEEPSREEIVSTYCTKCLRAYPERLHFVGFVWTPAEYVPWQDCGCVTDGATPHGRMKTADEKTHIHQNHNLPFICLSLVFYGFHENSIARSVTDLMSHLDGAPDFYYTGGRSLFEVEPCFCYYRVTIASMETRVRASIEKSSRYTLPLQSVTVRESNGNGRTFRQNERASSSIGPINNLSRLTSPNDYTPATPISARNHAN